MLSCADSQFVPLYLDVDTSSFYTELSLAQVGPLLDPISRLKAGLLTVRNSLSHGHLRAHSAHSCWLYSDFTNAKGVSILNLLCPQASLWCVTALWLAQSVLSFLRLYHSHSQHISGPCRPREKELLLGHSPSDSSSPSPPPATPTVLVWLSKVAVWDNTLSPLFCFHLSSASPRWI